MTEWTSLGVTEAQKDRIEAQKPDGKPMGKFLVQAVEEGKSTNTDLEELHKKVDQIQSAQGNTVSDALETAENSTIDYAEIERRMERVIEGALR